MANIFPVVAQIHLRNKNDISACFYALLNGVVILTGNGGGYSGRAPAIAEI
ncbi:hypothetical protein OUHCRE11_12960 [Enterobacter asburiae]|jgi:uncharacterized protein (UPF0333 family)|nr:hypothetical protein ENTKAS01_19040 [Enterobacter sp. AS-1]